MIKYCWFKDWFNSPYYLDVYSHRGEEEAKSFVDLIEKEIHPEKSWKILDFCCGSGRLSLELAERGFRVYGIDLSENLIQKAKIESLKRNLSVDFEICDMRQFSRVGEFDLVINFFTSFGYLNSNENQEVFNQMSQAVSPNGWFIFDYLNPDHLINSFVPFDVKYENGIKIAQSRKIENDRILKDIIIQINGNEEIFHESVQLYSREDIINFLDINNFKVHKIFGDYEGGDYRIDSPRMIFFSKKCGK